MTDKPGSVERQALQEWRDRLRANRFALEARTIALAPSRDNEALREHVDALHLHQRDLQDFFKKLEAFHGRVGPIGE